MKAQVCCLKYFRIFCLEEATIYLYNNSGHYCDLIGFQVRFRSKTRNSTRICLAALWKGGNQSTLVSLSGAAADWHGEGENAALNTVQQIHRFCGKTGEKSLQAAKSEGFPLSDEHTAAQAAAEHTRSWENTALPNAKLSYLCLVITFFYFLIYLVLS